jgi:hypothetical protein
MRVPRSGLWLLAAAALISSCSRSEAPPMARARHGLERESMKAIASVPRDKQKRRHDATVYVDGIPVAFVKFYELPPTLQPVVFPPSERQRKAPRYSVADYLEAVGVDLDKSKEAHFYGGRGRVAVVSGAELKAKRDVLAFRFTAGDRGNLRMEWPGRDKLQMTGLQADIINDIAVYVQRSAPQYDIPSGRVVDDAGKPIVGIPFAPIERPGGTRVYLDGRLVSSIKRKTLPDAVVVPGTPESGQTRFSLAKVLQMGGVDIAKVRGLEAISREAIVATLGPDDAARELARLEFVMPKESKGLIEMDTMKPGAKLEAVLLHSRDLPKRRPTSADAGSVSDQPTPENPGKNADATTARDVQSPIR